MSNKGMFKIPLFAILLILGQIRENSLIWSHHCIRKFSLIHLVILHQVREVIQKYPKKVILDFRKSRIRSLWDSNGPSYDKKPWIRPLSRRHHWKWHYRDVAQCFKVFRSMCLTLLSGLGNFSNSLFVLNAETRDAKYFWSTRIKVVLIF